MTAVRLTALILVLALIGCDSGSRAAEDAEAESPSDPYDAANMTFGGPPAEVTDAGPDPGTYAEGASLSLDAAVKPLVDDDVKVIRLDVTHTIIEIAPGLNYTAWTFGNQVPGPTIRARVGDRVRFEMTNRSDMTMPGVRLATPPMMHSMDFHSGMMAPDDKYRSIAPGRTIRFEFTLNYPGVFMYHCGTPMVLEHIASGMYGMFIVEPRDGYPTQVDREYTIVQSEFYTQESKQKIDGRPLHVLDGERLRSKQPTYTVFNGRYNGMVEEPLRGEPGDRVRLFVLNAGPSNTSSFHVVGTIFDRVWLDGNPDNEFRGMQTVLLGSSSGTIVEFYLPEAGTYTMVDHHFANASQGAVGLIVAGEPSAPGDPEHHNIPATDVPADPGAAQAMRDFNSKCLACHSIGGGPKLGPDLLGVTNQRSDEWLTRWLKEPEVMLQDDPDAKALLEQWKVPMPNQHLTDEEIANYIRYFHWADENVKPGSAQPAMAH
ncbi:MAG TPA: multicopper oxidase domain-containing protein [Pseudomonadales bacterium]